MGFKTEAPEMPSDLGELSKAPDVKTWQNQAPVRHSATAKRSLAAKKQAKRRAQKRVTPLPSVNFNLRLTESERALLEEVAAADGRSMQVVAKRVLFAELERIRASSTKELKRNRRGSEVEPEREAV